jgi:hypothetical protein
VHVDGPTVSPPLPAAASRWPHRVADLGPFALVDAAASVSADRRRIAVTLVNRSPDAAEEASLVLRDYAFAGPVAITTLTAADPPGTPGPPPPAVPPLSGPLSLTGIAGTRLAEATGPGDGPVLALSLPPRSFTVVEAPIAERRLA